MADDEAKETTSLRLRPSLRADLQRIAEENSTTVSALLGSCAEDLALLTAEELRVWLACPRCKGSGRRHG